MGNAKAKLTKEELKNLNCFLGFGDFSKTDILFWGVEEGCGPEQEFVNEFEQHRAEVVMRIKNVRDNPDSTFFLDLNDPYSGYWTTGHDFDIMREDCYKDLGFNYEVRSLDSEKHLWRQTWSYPARMMLALEEDDAMEMAKWLTLKGQLTKDQVTRIETLINQSVFGRNAKVRMSLTDWRPIPRRNAGKYWPFNDEIKSKEYLNAFQFKKVSDPFYETLRKDRVNKYKQIFDKFHIPVVFCYGEMNRTMKPMWRNMIKEMKSGHELKFNEVKIPNGKELNYAEVDFEAGKTTIIFTHHFMSGLRLGELEYVTGLVRQILRR